MVRDLIRMYRDGAITGYQVMIDCLHQLDPKQPRLVLSQLPDEILEEMLDYAHRYSPSSMRSNSGPPPTVDQVSAAQEWIEEKRRRTAKQNVAS